MDRISVLQVLQGGTKSFLKTPHEKVSDEKRDKEFQPPFPSLLVKVTVDLKIILVYTNWREFYTLQIR